MGPLSLLTRGPKRYPKSRSSSDFSYSFSPQRSGAALRILMSAYVCNPTRGSEAGVGWSVAQACASRHDVTLLTQSLERNDIEAALARDPELAAHLRVIYVDVPGSAPRREGRGNRLLHHRWQRRIVEVARDLHRQTLFDV